MTQASPAYPRLLLKAGRDVAPRRGHPWVFSGAVAQAEGAPVPGEVMDVWSRDGRPLGLFFYHPGRDIALRFLTGDRDRRIDASFWEERIREACALREKVVPADTNAYRLVNAEGDGLPGVVVDRYGDGLVFVIATAGMERQRENLVAALGQALHPRWMLERSVGRARQKEGLPERQESPGGCACPGEVEIRESGLRFLVDVQTGQKTGFFLDQRENRRRVQALAGGALVLNCFSYTGGFSVYALKGGAAGVVSVEASAGANERAAVHCAMNGLAADRHRIVRGDVFTYLREDSQLFDLIVLDPPAFAKGRRDVPEALRGYREIHRQAMARLRDGGLLATFSCSYPVTEELLAQAAQHAAVDAGKTVRMLERLGPGPDHPMLLSHPEGGYLKGFLLHVQSRR